MLQPRDDFRLRVRSRACAFDLRAVSANDREEVREGVDLCAVQGVVFGERPDEPPRRVVLANNHGRTVRQAFLAPTKIGEWGEDALGTAVLPPGARYEATFEGGGCHADLRVVFDTEAAEERRGIDICAETVISLRPGWTLDERLGPPPRAEEPATEPEKPEPAAATAAAEPRRKPRRAAPCACGTPRRRRWSRSTRTRSARRAARTGSAAPRSAPGKAWSSPRRTTCRPAPRAASPT